MLRETIVTINEDGRDKGKRFKIKEVPADQLEAFGIRVFLALTRSGVDVGDFAEMGTAGLAMMGLKGLSGVQYEEAKPLLEEMFECVQIMPDPNNSSISRSLVPGDIEEVRTRLKLRMEVANLHVGFSPAGALSTLAPATTGAGSTITKTSHRRSAR